MAEKAPPQEANQGVKEIGIPVCKGHQAHYPRQLRLRQLDRLPQNQFQIEGLALFSSTTFASAPRKNAKKVSLAAVRVQNGKKPG